MTLPVALREPVEHRATTALLTDYDGTLAPIVDDPARAIADPAALDALAALVPQYALVAVVSGRPAQFLREHVPVAGVVLVGQYGLERVVDDQVELDARAREHAPAVRAAAAEAAARWPALLLEHKGDVSFTIHWRTTFDAMPDATEVAALAARHGLVPQAGKMAWELRPPVPVDKGAAVTALLNDLAATGVIYLGDDEADLAAFDALDRLRGEAMAVARVAVRTVETPEALVERADVVVDGTAGLTQLLSRLAQP